MKLRSSDSTHPQRQKRPLMLEPAEPRLDAAALPIQGLVPLGVAWDERVQSVGQSQLDSFLAAGETPTEPAPARGVGGLERR